MPTVTRWHWICCPRAGNLCGKPPDTQEFDCATWLHEARLLSKDEFRREVERELTGKETEPWEIA